jgi:arylsulfatase A-like enzyme
LGAYGGTLVDTPNIDSIASGGALFGNFFVNSAVCTPSRGCMLTGRYPHCHGAYRNPVHINRDEVTLAHVLAKAGYDTAYMGKWHLDGETRSCDEVIPTSRSMGFADSRYMINRGHRKSVLEAPDGSFELSSEIDAGRYMTDWLVDKATDYLKRDREKPFFLMVSIPDPHQSYCVRAPYSTMFDPADMPLPSSAREDAALPSWACEAPMGADSWWGVDPDEREKKLREIKAAYCGEVKCIDDNVGRLLKCLDEHGSAENTIVIFTTDHGDYMGEHGLTGKNMVYEGVYRIPLVIRWPKSIKPGTQVERFVTTVDFQPTILGLMGIGLSGREQGRDASALLRGESPAWVDEAFFHHSRFGYAGIFTPDFELGLARGGEHVLFDRARDPDQMVNLIDDPEHAPVVEELAERVVRHNADLDSPAMEWLGDWRGMNRTQPQDLGPVPSVEWYNNRPESRYKLRTP